MGRVSRVGAGRVLRTMAARSGGIYKVALCGKRDVGKTSIFMRIRDDKFFEDTSKINQAYCCVTVKDTEGNAVQVSTSKVLNSHMHATQILCLQSHLHSPQLKTRQEEEGGSASRVLHKGISLRLVSGTKGIDKSNIFIR